MDTDDEQAEQEEAPKTAPRRKKRTGFALLTPERRQEISRRGGQTAHQNGNAHSFDSESARAAGKICHERGMAHVWTSETAREAGKKGGAAPHRNRPSK